MLAHAAESEMSNTEERRATSDVDREVPYLVMLAKPSAEELLAARRWLRDQGVRVLAEYLEGEHGGFEISTTHDRARDVLPRGKFSVCSRGPVEDPNPGHPSSIFGRWNVRFSDAYANQHVTHEVGLDGDRQRGTRVEKVLAKLGGVVRGLTMRLLRSRRHDAIGVLSAYARTRKLSQAVERLPTEGIGSYALAAAAKREKKVLEGRVGISVFIMDVLGDETLQFAPRERAFVLREIMDGLSWLAGEHPTGDLTFVYDVHDVQISLPSEPNVYEEWMRAAMAASEPGSPPPRGNAREAALEFMDRRFEHRQTVERVAIFVTPYRNDEPFNDHDAIHLAKTGVWYGLGRGQIDGIAAHELLHSFDGTDEYAHREAGKPPSLAEGAWRKAIPIFDPTALLTLPPRDQSRPGREIPNNNHVSVARPHLPCIMGYYPRYLCAYTRAHIGWTDLLVELETAMSQFAGTNSRVFLDIGERELELDIGEHDDRWPGQRIAYAIHGVTLPEVRRLMLRKDPGGAWEVWQLQRMRVWYQRDRLIYDSRTCGDIPEGGSAWLDDRNPAWLARRYGTPVDLINTLSIEVLVDGSNAGDGLELELGDRRWLVVPPLDARRATPQRHALDPGVKLTRAASGEITIRRLGPGATSGWRLVDLTVIIDNERLQPQGLVPGPLDDVKRTYRLIPRPAKP